MNKKALFTLSTIAALSIIGCGGGSGSSSSSNSSTTGTVNASFVKGVKVCTDNNSSCATTDDNGKFTLNGVSAPVSVNLYIGNSLLSSINIPSNSYAVTPAVLADSNATLAAYIGSFLHVLGDDTNLSKDKIDLSNITSVDINSSSNADLLTELKNYLDSGIKDINITINGNTTKEVNNTIATLYASTSPYVEGNSKNFIGAASVGDFVNFKYNKNNNTLNININGNIFGNISKTVNIEPIAGSPVFFQDTDNNNSFYFLSQSLSVGWTAINDTNYSYIVGAKMPNISSIDTSLFTNKHFNYINFNPDGSLEIMLIDLNATNPEDTNGTWSSYSSEDGTINGSWEINGTHVLVKENDSPVANFIIKPGKSRTILIVDDINGGFGIGVEAKPLTQADLNGTYYYYDNEYNATYEDICFGDVNVTGDTNESLGNFIGKDNVCFTNGIADYNNTIYSGKILLNPTIDLDGNLSTTNDQYTLNGLAAVLDDNNQSTGEYVFIDPEDGFFVDIDTNNTILNKISVGSNKPIK
jgi:hypothetical protein